LKNRLAIALTIFAKPLSYSAFPKYDSISNKNFHPRMGVPKNDTGRITEIARRKIGATT